MSGAIRKLYRNTLFRLSLLGALLFVLSLGVALGYIYYATISSELRRVDRVNEAEIEELQMLYDRAGEVAVVNAIDRGLLPPNVSRTNPDVKSVYHQAGHAFLKNAVFQRGLSSSLVLERVYILNGGPGTQPTGNLVNRAVQRTGQETSLIPEKEDEAFTRLEFIYSAVARRSDCSYG